MKAKRKFDFLVALSMASAALVTATPATSEAAQSAQAITQKITLPSQLVLTPAAKVGAKANQYDDGDNHASHASHESHESHASHYSSGE